MDVAGPLPPSDASRPLLFHSLWGQAGDLADAVARVQRHGFAGIEANLRHPTLSHSAPEQVRLTLAEAGMPLIIELVTGGDYVPRLEEGPDQQLAELERLLPEAELLEPLRITLITGSDSWGAAQQRHFLSRAVQLARQSSVPVSFETHRSRSLFNPWSIRELLDDHPLLRLTADLSHWCCVSERLMEPELEPVLAMADRVDHIHARIGHAQGPSVGHPFAPEAAVALEAHRRCWQLFLQRQQERGHGPTTITPEFGPDGYLPVLPFTGMPVADLLTINSAMAAWITGGALSR